MIKLLSTAVLALIFGAVLIPAFRSAAAETEDGRALTLVTRELCPVQVAMLGESATHGDGHTEAFKVALVQRLVEECGFDTVLFEASHYEFLHLAASLRRGEAVSADQVLSAIGGLWKFDGEFQPLAPFLLEKARRGKISLGGIDDQLGQMGQDFANVEMVGQLTGLLPEGRRQACAQALRRRIYSDYPETAPYAPEDRLRISTCLSDIRRAAAADKAEERADEEDRLEMVSSFERWIHRDFTADAQMMMARDRSMFENFEWLMRRRPPAHKVIVWAATVHIAKQGDPTWGDRSGKNFGSYLHGKYRAKAFSLGFSAVSGSYRQGGRKLMEMPPAPPLSLEARAFRRESADAVYVAPAELAKAGRLPAELFRHAYQTLPWCEFLDGIVVFPEEHPPSSTR